MIHPAILRAVIPPLVVVTGRTATVRHGVARRGRSASLRPERRTGRSRVEPIDAASRRSGGIKRRFATVTRGLSGSFDYLSCTLDGSLRCLHGNLARASQPFADRTLRGGRARCSNADS